MFNLPVTREELPEPGLSGPPSEAIVGGGGGGFAERGPGPLGFRSSPGQKRRKQKQLSRRVVALAGDVGEKLCTDDRDTKDCRPLGR
jgi:hypothetical protein